MSDPTPTTTAEFDAYSAEYDAALNQGISVSGEDKNFFCQGRIKWVSRLLPSLGVVARTVMDFGCGTGTATPFLLDLMKAETVIGLDVSAGSLLVARRDHGSDAVRFALFKEYQPAGQVDVIYCNGVFHHIPLAERAASIAYAYQSLRPGGLFALWENNPWNPGTRYVMSRIPFDRDAITLTPPETRRLLRAGGFEVLRTHYLFFFPRLLNWLRWSEPYFRRIPLGAQYLVLARKP